MALSGLARKLITYGVVIFAAYSLGRCSAGSQIRDLKDQLDRCSTPISYYQEYEDVGGAKELVSPELIKYAFHQDGLDSLLQDEL